MNKIDFRPYLFALSGKAFKSADSRGRRFPISQGDDASYSSVINPFLIDELNIRASKSYRRLGGKTQVFPCYLENMHARNRWSHTEEVVALAVQIATILGVNVNLVRAIATGHDIGHTPFGHLGEETLTLLSGRPFRHEIMSVVLLQKLERGGLGTNPCWETVDGILHHSTGKNGLITNHSLPIEYAIVMFADKIAYTFADLDDALRLRYFTEEDLPSEFFALGKNQRERVLNCIFALVKESSEKGSVSFHDSETAQKFEALRQWSFKNFYGRLNEEGHRVQARSDLRTVYNFMKEFSADPFLAMALMTDQEARNVASFAKKPTLGSYKAVQNLSFMEFIQRLPNGHQVDIFKPDLFKKDFLRRNLS